MKPEIIFEVKNHGATMEWTASASEAEAAYSKLSRGGLYKLNTSTGRKFLLKSK